MSLRITSSAFSPGAAIPPRYTADGADRSPPLDWSGEPQGTASFALVCDDPDAPRGDWVHWVLFNLPADVHQLPEHAQADGTLSSGARQGRNDFGKLGYGGPSPPPGTPHRYVFTLYALDAALPLPAGASRAELLQATAGHVLAQASVTGTYRR